MSPAVCFLGANPLQAVKWGDINVVDAERRLLSHAMLDPGNDALRPPLRVLHTPLQLLLRL